MVLYGGIRILRAFCLVFFNVVSCPPRRVRMRKPERGGLLVTSLASTTYK